MLQFTCLTRFHTYICGVLWPPHVNITHAYSSVNQLTLHCLVWSSFPTQPYPCVVWIGVTFKQVRVRVHEGSNIKSIYVTSFCHILGGCSRKRHGVSAWYYNCVSHKV